MLAGHGVLVIRVEGQRWGSEGYFAVRRVSLESWAFGDRQLMARNLGWPVNEELNVRDSSSGGRRGKVVTNHVDALSGPLALPAEIPDPCTTRADDLSGLGKSSHIVMPTKQSHVAIRATSLARAERKWEGRWRG